LFFEGEWNIEKFLIVNVLFLGLEVKNVEIIDVLEFEALRMFHRKILLEYCSRNHSVKYIASVCWDRVLDVDEDVFSSSLLEQIKSFTFLGSLGSDSIMFCQGAWKSG
jgi:hypothetical protein